jgi:hypothetical protein
MSFIYYNFFKMKPEKIYQGPHLRTPKLRVITQGLNPFCYIVNAGGGTRGDSEFRRPEMWAQETAARAAFSGIVSHLT